MSDGAPQRPARRLSRRGGDGRPAAPVRLVHLGLGNFFRAHQVWHTDRSPDAEDWGIAAFSGRSAAMAEALEAQDGLYTLVTRGADGDRFEVLASLSRAHAAADHAAWLGYLASPDVAAVTITVTEAGYLRDAQGGLDVGRSDVQADVDALRTSITAPVATAPARLVAGLAARRSAGGAPLALVPCDNVAGNGAIVEQVVADMAALIDPDLASWAAESVSVVSTMVDRITPRTAPADVETVRAATGVDDAGPVVTEPFHDWVLAGTFPSGRPRWEEAGATFTDDITPFEHRKLWLLNGAHSLLAYAGSIRGHETVAEAVADDTCRGWVEDWWGEASPHLGQADESVAAYRGALSDRFGNARIRHLLAQIAADGSQKVPIRILPTLRAERAAGRLPTGATRVVAAWICHLRGQGAPVADAGADVVVPLAAGPLPEAVRRVLAWLDPALGDDGDVVATIADQAGEMAPAGTA